MKKLKVGFIGAGFMSQLCHLPCFAADDRVVMESISDMDSSILDQVATRFNIKNRYKNHQEMLGNHGLDAVVIAVQRPYMATIIKDALAMNIHILAEKPVTLTSATAKQLINLQAQHHGKVSVGYMKRFDEAVHHVKKIVTSRINDFGSIKSVYMRNACGNSYCNPFEYIQRSNLGDHIKNNKVALTNCEQDTIINHKCWPTYEKYLNVFSHDFNLLRYLFGNLALTRSNVDNQGEGSVSLLASKIPITFDTQFSSSPRWIESIQINFEYAQLLLELPPALLKNTPGKVTIESYRTGDITSLHFNWSWSFKKQAEGFVSFARGEAENINPLSDSLKDIQLIEKIFIQERFNG